MKRLEFSLQSVLELRLREEDKAKMALAEKERELRDRQRDQEEAHQSLLQFQRDEKESRARGRFVEEFALSVSWRHKLKLELLEKAQQVQEVMRDIDIVRGKLIEATKRRKGIELLRDKKQELWQKERNRKDQAFLDELASNAHIRKKRKQ